MEIISGTSEFQLDKDTAVAIGKFDGIHIGHRSLLEEILIKKKDGLAACVFTFDPLPQVLFGNGDRKILSTREEKRIAFERLGVDILVEFPMTKETAAIEPERFVRDVLVKKMRVKYLVAGSDLSFGAKGAGNAALVEQLSSELEFRAKTIEKVYLQGGEVSSTWLRKCVEQGDMEMAEKLLGMPYGVSGQVVGGNKIGRTLGFPTINLMPDECKLLPPCGVYFSKVLWNEEWYSAISNVGYKPTVTEEKKLGVETYLYDFNRMIYGEDVEVFLCKFHRKEQRFENLEALQEQLKQDILDGKLFHEC